MKKEIKELKSGNELILTFIILLLCCSIFSIVLFSLVAHGINKDLSLIKEKLNITDTEEIDFYYKHIELNNNNIGLFVEVVEFMCTEGLKVNNLPEQNWFYASAYKDAQKHSGECLLKIKGLEP